MSIEHQSVFVFMKNCYHKKNLHNPLILLFENCIESIFKMFKNTLKIDICAVSVFSLSPNCKKDSMIITDDNCKSTVRIYISKVSNFAVPN